MVAAVRKGDSQRSVARRFRVSLPTVQRWVGRAEGQRLDRVDFSDCPSGPRQAVNRTDVDMEELVIQTRQELRQYSDLGEYGAEAVYHTLRERGFENIPSVRTIGRIFERRGELDGRKRLRRPAPPRGWYLPDVALERAEVDQFDIVEGLKIKEGPLVEVLNAVSLHGRLVDSWPQAASIKAVAVQQALIEHWREVGLPDYAQFDNDTVFQGPHQHTDVISRVMRLCLSLGVVPVFTPPRETGFQASIEHYNGLWQTKVWARFEHTSLQALQTQSRKYVRAHRNRTAKYQESAPQRRIFPNTWQLDLQKHPADYPHARLVFIRRTNHAGCAILLGHSFAVDNSWTSRLIRCEVLLTKRIIYFYRLRRRAPKEQPLLNETPYELPRRYFRE